MEKKNESKSKPLLLSIGQKPNTELDKIEQNCYQSGETFKEGLTSNGRRVTKDQTFNGTVILSGYCTKAGNPLKPTLDGKSPEGIVGLLNKKYGKDLAPFKEILIFSQLNDSHKTTRL